MNFKRSFLFLFVLACVGCEEPKKPQPLLHVNKEQPKLSEDIATLQKELSELDTDAYVEAYIIRIINEGSKGIALFRAENGLHILHAVFG